MPSPLSLLLSIVFAFTALAVHADTTQEWPSLRVNFTFKHESMQVYGQSKFSVVASPKLTKNATKVLYDVFAAFDEGSTRYNYTLVDGIPYVSGGKTSLTRCLDSDALPPINGIVAALNEAVVVSGGGDLDCSSGTLFKTTINGFDFAVCYSGESGFSMHSSGMDITVEYLKDRVAISPPMTDNNCVSVASPSSVTAIGAALLTGSSITTRKLEADFELGNLFGSDDSCSCKSSQRPCVFIHGLGVDHEEPTNVDSFSQYWGNLTGYAPCCSSMQYAMLDTLNNSWTNATQQQKVCDRMLEVGGAKQDSTISDTIVITHSMGGLMVAGALANGKCSFANSTSWVALAAPMKGSMASDHFQDSCKKDTNFVMEAIVESTGFCPAGSGIQSLAYEGERYSNPELDKAYEEAQKVYREHTTGILCSNSFSGLLSDYQYEFWTLGLMVPHKSPQNDGMVEFASCAAGIPESEFGNTYLDKYYVTKVNHGDASFRGIQGLIDKAKMPKKWFKCLL